MATPPPVAPVPFTATPVSTERIDLAWANVENETGYRVERSSDDVSYGLIASLAADDTSYDDSGLSAATTYYYTVTAFNNGGDSPSANTSAETLASVDHTAVAESTTYGSVIGTYSDTANDDASVESIVEIESGGKKSKRHTRLQHRWQFSVSSGTSATVVANAWKSGTAEDNFDFEYSTDGIIYSPLFTVTSTDSSNEQIALIPGAINNTVYVQVIDTDHNQGNQNAETVHVDHLYVRIQGSSSGTLPAAPGNLNAIAISASRVDLAWMDLSDDELGFTIERSLDGSSWQQIASAAANANTYSDNTVTGDTLYYYRINAHNLAGSSAWDGPVAVQTPLGIVLTGNGYKVKGIQHADLGWMGTSGQVLDIYRDGNVIHTVSATEPTTYTENIGRKGSGSYTYQVCESSGSRCSNELTLIF